MKTLMLILVATACLNLNANTIQNKKFSITSSYRPYSLEKCNEAKNDYDLLNNLDDQSGFSISFDIKRKWLGENYYNFTCTVDAYLINRSLELKSKRIKTKSSSSKTKAYKVCDELKTETIEELGSYYITGVTEVKRSGIFKKKYTCNLHYIYYQNK